MFLVLGVCSFSEKCVFCNTQGFNRIYIHHVRSNQTNGTVHAHKHHDIGEKRFFAESSGNMQSVYSKQTQIHHNITSMMLYVDELSSKCYCLFIFSARTKSVDSSESYNKIQVLLSIQLERIFPPLHFAQKKTNKSKRVAHETTRLLNIAIAGWYCMLWRTLVEKCVKLQKKICIFSRFFRTMPRFLTRPIWRVPSANPQTICEWVTPNPPSSLRKFQIFDFFQEKMQTPSLWYIFGIVFRNAFEKYQGFHEEDTKKIKQLHRQETPLRKSMYLRRLNGNARTFSSKPKATQDSMWFSHDWKWKWLNCFSVCVRHPCAECHAITTANWHELWHKHSLQTNLRTRP